VLPINPPLLSDHSLVVAEIDSLRPYDSTMSADLRSAGNWRSIDVDLFAADLLGSELVTEPPDDVMAAFACYDVTLRSLLDKFAPLQPVSAQVQEFLVRDSQCVHKQSSCSLENCQ
jgi:hypothetical protein